VIGRFLLQSGGGKRNQFSPQKEEHWNEAEGGKEWITKLTDGTWFPQRRSSLTSTLGRGVLSSQRFQQEEKTSSEKRESRGGDISKDKRGGRSSPDQNPGDAIYVGGAFRLSVIGGVGEKGRTGAGKKRKLWGKGLL